MTNNVLYVSDGDYGTPAGYLLPLVQGQFGQSIPLEIRDLAGNVVNLTDYTFTATKRKGSTVTAWVGAIVLSATPTAAPQVTLTVDEDDTGTDGGFYFFLEATNGSQTLKSHPVSLTITKDPAVNATAAPGLVGVTTAQKALLAVISGLTGLVKMAGGVASAILIKLDGTAAPGVNDDSGDGYGIGSIWIDTTNDNAYIATDVTVGAANWEQINGGGGGAVDSVFARTGAVVAASGDYGTDEITDDSVYAKPSLTDALDTIANDVGGLDTSINTHIGASTTVHGIADTAALLDTGDLGVSVQGYSAKIAAIAALTWAVNSIVLLTGTATASVQALAAHVVTFIQSASAADARTAIGAGTGNGDVTGPASSTANGIPTFSGTGGKTLQSNAATLSDLGGSDGITINGVQTIRSNGTSSIRLARGSTGALLATFLTDTGTLTETSGFKWRNHSGINSWYALANYWLGYEGNTWARIYGDGFLTRKITGIDGTATTVYANGTGDVTLVLSGTFTISDGAGNVAGGVITATAPGANFNLYDDGGTNTCQLQVAADGSVTVIRTAGARTYACNLNLNWM